MFQWQYMFSQKILARGKDYFRHGWVVNLEEEDGSFYATVAGSEHYDVVIRTSGGHLVSMGCNCPYARDGHACKHMAAVLYQIASNETKAPFRNGLFSSKGKESIWKTPEKKRCYPFLKPMPKNGEETYSYFDLESITAHVIIYEDVLKKARKVLESGELSNLHTVTNMELIKGILFPVVSRQYWYFTAYFGMYFFVPFVNKMIQNLDKKEYTILCMIIIIVYSLLPVFGLKRIDSFNMNWGYSTATPILLVLKVLVFAFLIFVLCWSIDLIRYFIFKICRINKIPKILYNKYNKA